MLKLPQSAKPKTVSRQYFRASSRGTGTAGSDRNAERLPDGTMLHGAEPALRNAWRVNLVDLSFRSVTTVTLAASWDLCLFVVAVLPPSESSYPADRCDGICPGHPADSDVLTIIV